MEVNSFLTMQAFSSFSANPQRILSWAYVRLLRYETVLANSVEIGLVSHERSFTGALPTQIRNIRAYFQESGFFKKYQVRNPVGGFSEQPEFPLVQWTSNSQRNCCIAKYAVHIPTEM